MATAHQQPRASSRPPSRDGFREISTHQVDSKAATKRLFSNRESRLSNESEDYGENTEREASDEVLHSGKRQRSSGWPFPNTSPSISSAPRYPLQSRNAPNSPSSPRRPVSQARSSKFVEGSMNDRVSKKPPTTYTGTEEELRSRFDYDEQEGTRGRKLARPRKLTTRASSSVAPPSVADRSDSSRHSTIFRFGKSLAATFNPSNWKIWSKQQQSPVEDEETAHLGILRERQEKAERMYKELKEAGHFRGRSVGPRDRELRADSSNLHSKHDSGIEFAGHETGSARVSREMSREDKRKGRIFLDAPRIPHDHRDESPASIAGSAVPSNASSPTKQSFHFKKPSLSSIKKALIAEGAPNVAEDRLCQRSVPRIPSRKDLQKQQKLVKRVSDLEGKLEAARRQLSEALNEPVPDQPPSKIGRSRFVPGALASLPSERLLSGYVSSDPGFSDNESHAEVGKAVTVDYMEDNEASERKSVAPTHKVAAPPSWVGKPVSRPGTPPQDRILPTVEHEELIREKAVSDVGHMVAETATTISEPSTKAYDPNDLDYVEEGSDGEKPGKRRPVEASIENTPNKKTSSKKRKSIFERQADDGGQYKPSQDTDSDPESEVKKSTPRKKDIEARPRKLQKTVQESNDDPSSKASTAKLMKTPSSSQDHTYTSGAVGSNQTNGSSVDASSLPGRRNSLKGMKKLTSPPPSSRIAKSRIPQKGKQSLSPPPSSSFTGLDYMKPSLAKQAVKDVGELVNNDVAYSADPTTDDSVPPMPTMPKAIRLVSGEVIQTTALTFASGTSKASSSGPTKLIKPRPAPKENEKRENKKQDNDKEADDDFHWDRDTF